MAARKPPVTETKTVSEVRRTFSETLNRVYRGETRVLVEKNGIPVGAMVSAWDLERLRAMDLQREQALSALADIQSGFEGIPEDELERELERALAEAKEIRRRAREFSAKKPA